MEDEFNRELRRRLKAPKPTIEELEGTLKKEIREGFEKLGELEEEEKKLVDDKAIKEEMELKKCLGKSGSRFAVCLLSVQDGDYSKTPKAILKKYFPDEYKKIYGED